MEIKMEPSYNTNDLKPKRQGSAFKQVDLLKPSASSEHTKYKFKVEDYDNSAGSSFEISSSSSSTSSTSSFPNTSQINPFYIDKIFNFQNMYLFPGAHSTPIDTPNHVHQSHHNHSHHQSGINNPLMLNDLQNIMQQNLLQNFYTYYNNSHLQQANMHQHHTKIKQNNTEQKPKSKNNFSIERILSLPSDLKQVETNAKHENPMYTQNPHIPYNGQNLLMQKNLNEQLLNTKYNRFSTPIAITAPIPPLIAASMMPKQVKLANSNRGYNSYKSHAQNLIGGNEHRDHQQVKSNKNAKKYKCDLCGRGFSRSNTLITHRRIHTGEKPFECNICGRAFRQPGNLTRHKLTHTTIKPYSCNKCGKSFNRVSNLHAHIKIHSDGKPYVCIVCGCSFYQKVDLKLHALSHSSDKIHECSFCKRTFKQAAHLKYHLHSHLKQFDKFDTQLKDNRETGLRMCDNGVRLSSSSTETNQNVDHGNSLNEAIVKEENSQGLEQDYKMDEHEDEDIEDDEENEESDEEEDDDEDNEEEEEDLNEIEIENISNGYDARDSTIESSNSLNNNDDCNQQSNTNCSSSDSK